MEDFKVRLFSDRIVFSLVGFLFAELSEILKLNCQNLMETQKLLLLTQTSLHLKLIDLDMISLSLVAMEFSISWKIETVYIFHGKLYSKVIS